MAFISREKIYNLAIYGFGQAVNLFSPLLVIPYIVSVCGETGLGKAGVGFSFALIAIVLVDYGSYINGTKSISINKKSRTALEEIFLSIYLAKLFLLILVIVICAVIILLIPFFKRDQFQLFFSLLIVVGQFINPTWFFQGIQNFKWISIINVTSKAIYVLSVFLFIKSPGDYIFINAFLGIGLIISSTIGFAWIYRHYSFSLSNFSIANSIQLLKSEFTLTVSQIFFSIYQYAPIMLISYVCGDFVAGQYRIIDQIVMIFRTYLQMFFNFVYAEICLSIFEDFKHGISEWKKYNGYNYILVILFSIVFYLNAELVLMFFKVSQQNLAYLTRYFKIGLIIPLFMGVSFPLKQLMFSFDKNKAYISITIVTTILNVFLMLFLLKFIGLKGAFISTAIIEFLIINSYLLALRKKLMHKNV